MRLEGSVTLQALYPLLSEIGRAARQRPGTQFRLDCSAVTDISGQALTEMVKLRRDIRSHGCELMLTHCSDSLWTSLKGQLFESLVEEERPMKEREKTPEFQGPHEAFQAKWKPAKTARKGKRREPYFLRLRGTRYQRFWLN